MTLYLTRRDVGERKDTQEKGDPTMMNVYIRSSLNLHVHKKRKEKNQKEISK